MKKFLFAFIMVIMSLSFITEVRAQATYTDQGTFSVLDNHLGFFNWHVSILGDSVTTYTNTFQRKDYDTSYTHWFDIYCSEDSVAVTVIKQYSSFPDSGYIDLETLFDSVTAQDTLFTVTDSFAEQSLFYRYKIFTEAGTGVAHPTIIKERTVFWKKE